MDVTQDITHSNIYHICEMGAPDYVLNARITTKEAAARLPDSLFADSFNRRYPIDSKANTWMSGAFFARTSARDGYDEKTAEHVRSEILRAADAYGNRADVEAAMAKAAPRKPVEKRASDDSSNYGWPERRKYPMFDREGVEKASEYFAENAYQYTPGVRHDIARRILRKCAEYGVEPSRAVSAESFMGMAKRDAIGAAIVDRARMCKSASLAADMMKVGQALLALPGEIFRRHAVKFAETLEGLDMANGFHLMYGTRFASPAQIFFGTTVKEAQAELGDIVVLGGQAFSIEKLAELPEEVFTGALGEDFGRRVKAESGGIDREKLAGELNSMPMPDKRALYGAIVEFTR